jgi:hypothetical protein
MTWRTHPIVARVGVYKFGLRHVRDSVHCVSSMSRAPICKPFSAIGQQEEYMRRALLISVFTTGLAACASSPSASTGATPAPSGAGAAASASTAATTNRCAAGGCILNLVLEPSVGPIMAEKRLMYKVYKGCPRSLGGETAQALRALTPMVETSTPIIQLPAFEGRYLAVAMWMGAQPAGGTDLLVVDFGEKNNVVAKLPFIEGPSGYRTDDVIVREIGTAIRRCR